MRKFRVYPSTDCRHYFLCVIHSTYQSFLKTVIVLLGEEGASTLGVMWPYYKERKGERVRKVGEIHLYPDSLTPDIVAHEIDHAATHYLIHYLNLPALSPETEEDELRAAMVGRLHSQFWSELNLP